jgi:hypothetical protein
MSDSDRESFDEPREAFDGKTFHLWLKGEEAEEERKRLELEKEKERLALEEERKRLEIEEERKRLEIEEERKRLEIEEERKGLEIEEERKRLEIEERKRLEIEEKKERILKATIHEQLKRILLDSPFVFIDDILFIIFQKYRRSSQFMVRIFFVLSDGTFDFFWCYRSSSEMGLWRLCWELPGKRNHKGTLDYVQGTLIHLTLQRLLNDHSRNLKIIDDEYFTRLKGCKLSQSTQMKIEDRNRLIEEPPFTYLQRKDINENIGCGMIPPEVYETDIVSKVMSVFSRSFTEQFEVDMNSLDLITSYQFEFEKRLIADVSLYCILLHRKPMVLSRFEKPPRQNTVVLCLSKVKLRIASFSDDQFKENATRICEQDFHIFPFLLTVPQAKITTYGCYSHFIPSGIFICKLFDYYSHSLSYYQCTFKEEQTGKCSSRYAYIGGRYADVFPINRIIEHFRRPWRPSPTVASLSASSEDVKKAGPGGRRSKQTKRRRKRTYKKKYQYLKNP